MLYKMEVIWLVVIVFVEEVLDSGERVRHSDCLYAGDFRRAVLKA